MCHVGLRTAKQHLSVRLDREVLDRLGREAEERDIAQSRLVQRYVDEGIRRDRHPLIDFREGAGGRRAVLKGTRLDVAKVVETLRHHRGSIEKTAKYFEVEPEVIRAAAAYHADYPDDVDEWIARERAAAERYERAWRRQKASA